MTIIRVGLLLVAPAGAQSPGLASLAQGLVAALLLAGDNLLYFLGDDAGSTDHVLACRAETDVIEILPLAVDRPRQFFFDSTLKAFDKHRSLVGMFRKPIESHLDTINANDGGGGCVIGAKLRDRGVQPGRVDGFDQERPLEQDGRRSRGRMLLEIPAPAVPEVVLITKVEYTGINDINEVRDLLEVREQLWPGILEVRVRFEDGHVGDQGYREEMHQKAMVGLGVDSFHVQA